MHDYLGYIRREDKSIYFMGLLFFPAFIAANFLQIYLPKLVVEELTEKRGIVHLGILILVLTVILGVSILVREKMKARIEKRNRMLVNHMKHQYAQKNLYVDYRGFMSPEFKELRAKAYEGIFGGDVGDENLNAYLSRFAVSIMVAVTCLGNVILYVYFLAKLSPWLIVLMLSACFFGAMAGKVTHENELMYAKKSSEAFSKLEYVSRKTEDFSFAKDIRLYGMQGYFMGLIDRFINERLFYKKKELKKRMWVDIRTEMALTLQTIFLYAYILYRIVHGDISVADLVFYAGLAPEFAKLVTELTNKLRQSFTIAIRFERFHEFMDYGENTGEEERRLRKEPVEIKLKNVSYRYPEEQTDVLHNLSLVIKPEERIAIVGVNGAGKTTLMKLLCGLLRPTEGKIYLNGKDMEEMSSEERFAYFSCAFQDVRFLPLTIRENISMCTKQDTDDSRVWSCLKKAGIEQVVETLPDGLDTLLDKNINEDAVDFSGGQRQKLILARSLYREAGCLILDEPTAALDALAENEIYEKYAELSKGKTSFFVSHRLSSTRFCDRILLIDGGNVAEEGTHEGLLAAGGLYANMFAMQAKYYQNAEEV